MLHLARMLSEDSRFIILNYMLTYQGLTQKASLQHLAQVAYAATFFTQRK